MSRTSHHADALRPLEELDEYLHVLPNLSLDPLAVPLVPPAPIDAPDSNLAA